ncbi:MAG: hypothetical protein VB084_17205 [Syntrophomonadaceae bacterium]|nr:hypothetical protein [Syntrophomonadaceae bacterium]
MEVSVLAGDKVVKGTVLLTKIANRTAPLITFVLGLVNHCLNNPD